MEVNLISIIGFSILIIIGLFFLFYVSPKEAEMYNESKIRMDDLAKEVREDIKKAEESNKINDLKKKAMLL